MKILKSIKCCLALVLLATPLLVHSWPVTLKGVYFTVYALNLKGPVYYSIHNYDLFLLHIPGSWIFPSLEYDLFETFPENGPGSEHTQYNVYFYYLNHHNIILNTFRSSGNGPSNFATAIITAMDIKALYKYKNIEIKNQDEADKIVNALKAVKCENTANTLNMNGRKINFYANQYNQGGYVKPSIILENGGAKYFSFAV